MKDVCLLPRTAPVASTSVGPPTRQMAQNRARELALLAGRGPLEVRQRDYEQAKRELTGESDVDRQNALLDSVPELHVQPLHRLV